MIFFFSFLFSYVSAIYEPLNLDDETFESQLMQSPVNFVMASNSNVSFCQEILPKFRAVAEMMKDRCQFVILENDVSPKMRQKYGIFAYPSFFVFRYSNYSAEYKGERDASHFLEYLKRILADPVPELDSARDVHDFLEETDSAVILAGDSIDDNLYSIFKSVAQNLTDRIPFAIARNPDATQQLGLEELPALRLHRSQDRKIIDFPLAFDVKENDLRKWVLENMVPRYAARDAVIFRDLAFDQRYSILAFVDTSRKSSLDSMHSTMDRLVTEFGSNFTYVYSDIYDIGTIVLQLGFSGAREPVYCIAMLTGGEVTEKHLFPERRTASPDNLAKWVRQFMNSTNIKQMNRSEDPIHDQKGPLYKVVGIEFMNAIYNPQKDVVALIISGNEKDKARKMKLMETVAHEFKKQRITSVSFIWMDIDLNDVPGLPKSNFKKLPAILIFPAAEKKQPYLLQDDLDEFLLMNSILAHAKTRPKFKIPGKYDSGSLEL
ncbi:hypothetical protein TRFO_10394 [Tritrichomonas foetus]|uniref:Thioredoxin domain-containing protein n=1 Tax=Tritrichomonas foetus TaxID=1144522 RepID=A0A1J4JAN8_9EUKA|nr:hypothetical protein TRFO_10394 [Tritrichomonas foetus]|eukprot:OHS95737.1 hypothetical protein TRFO_10394 [Tritrichomonas foetus]